MLPNTGSSVMSKSPSTAGNKSDDNDEAKIRPTPLVATNPPLVIMRGRQRRVKGDATRKKKKRKPFMSTAIDELRGYLLVLLVIAIFVAVEVIFVDQLFLGSGGRIANTELRINSANVFVSDIVEASLNRYRLKPGVEFQKVLETAEDNVIKKLQGVVPPFQHKIEKSVIGGATLEQ